MGIAEELTAALVDTRDVITVERKKLHEIRDALARGAWEDARMLVYALLT
jgi:hypothetical protein